MKQLILVLPFPFSVASIFPKGTPNSVLSCSQTLPFSGSSSWFKNFATVFNLHLELKIMEVNPTALSVSTRLFLSWLELFLLCWWEGKGINVSVGVFPCANIWFEWYPAGKKEKRENKVGYTWLKRGDWVGGVSNQEDLTFSAFVDRVMGVKVAGGGDFLAYYNKKWRTDQCVRKVISVEGSKPA